MDKNNWTIRRAQPTDLESLVHFNQTMAMETESKTLDATTLTRGVNAVLSDANLGFYLVAETDGKVAGSLMITREWSDWRAADFWWIQSVFVAPEFRRQGVYRALYDGVIRLAKKQNNVCGIRLYVEQDNLKAQQTYRALGMGESHYRLYETSTL